MKSAFKLPPDTIPGRREHIEFPRDFRRYGMRCFEYADVMSLDELLNLLAGVRSNVHTRAASVRKKTKTLIALVYHVGPLATLLFIADKLLRRLTKARILFVSMREPELLAGLEPMLPAGFTAEVRRPDALGNLTAACAAELSADFLMEATSHADRCVVILEDDYVISFQWLADRLTRAYEDIWIGFGPRYLYGYKSFTAPSHRGKHLNRSGVVIAAQMLAIPQGKGLAGFIMADNVASLLAHSRVLPKYSGVVLVWPHGAQGLRIFASPGCRGRELQLVRRPTKSSTLSPEEPLLHREVTQAKSKTTAQSML